MLPSDILKKCFNESSCSVNERKSTVQRHVKIVSPSTKQSLKNFQLCECTWFFLSGCSAALEDNCKRPGNLWHLFCQAKRLTSSKDVCRPQMSTATYEPTNFWFKSSPDYFPAKAYHFPNCTYSMYSITSNFHIVTTIEIFWKHLLISAIVSNFRKESSNGALLSVGEVCSSDAGNDTRWFSIWKKAWISHLFNDRTNAGTIID